MRRRQYIRSAAALGAAGFAAGCSGLGNVGQQQEITITSFPTNFPPLEYVEQNGIMEEEMNSAGYDVSIQWTFEGPALFASGQGDIAFDISSIGAARMAQERDFELTVAAKMMTDNIGMILESGGPYDPAETGGRQATVDKIVEDGATVGIIGWSAGHIPVDQILFQDLWGYDLAQEGGDFETASANPGALPQLMKDGEVDMIANSPAHGAGADLMNEDFVDLFYGADEIAKQDMGMAPLLNCIVKDSFMEDNPDAVRAALRAWDRGTDWFYESGVEDIPGNSTYMEHFSTEDDEVAEYITKWHLTSEYKDIPSAFETDTPIYHNDPTMDQEYLDANAKFMDRAAEIGQAPENWQDLLTYEQLSL